MVWATDFDGDSAKATAALIEQSGGRAEAMKLDVRYEEEWRQALAPATVHDDKLTIMVNCAGTSMMTDTLSMSLDDFRRILDVTGGGPLLGDRNRSVGGKGG